jgi:hypothetical protein
VEFDFVKQIWRQCAFQAFPELDGKNLSGRDAALKPGDIVVEVFMVNVLDDGLVDSLFEVGEIENHAGARVGGAANGDFQDVIMSMAVRIGTFIIEGDIFLGG